MQCLHLKFIGTRSDLLMEHYTSIDHIPPAGQITALTIGKFEGMHIGHQKLCRQLSAQAGQAGIVSTVVSFLNDPKDIVGEPDHIEKMIWPLDMRAGFMADCGIQRQIFIPFNTDVAQIEPRQFVEDFILETMQAVCIICGEDFRFGKGGRGDTGLLREICSQADCEVSIQPHTTVDNQKVSSSAICRLLIQGQFKAASELLGRTYYIEGLIQSGRGIGRTLGFPTLNLHYPDEVLVPEGIFGGWVAIKGQRYPAAVNSGRRPTIEPNGRNIVEMHILEGEVPEHVGTVRLYPEFKVRDEEPFESREALTVQIAEDCRIIREQLGIE